MSAHSRDPGISQQTVQRAIKKVGGKNLVRIKRPLLTPAMNLLRCKTLSISFELFFDTFGQLSALMPTPLTTPFGCMSRQCPSSKERGY
uniref:Uncharacterized protein n=1 Tax=Lepeophtheirus salmonis TaxID=72036 RepID=A0A0K2TG26_LEPSM